MKLKRLGILAIALLLASCNFEITTSSKSSKNNNSNTITSNNNTSNNVTSTSSNNNGGLVENPDGSTKKFSNVKKNDKTFDKFHEYENNTYEERITYLPHSGESKLLVIPVIFKGQTVQSVTGYSESQGLDRLNNAFFGESSDTGWESVASYYKKSSYNNLNLTGKVTNWFTSSKSYNDMVNLCTYNSSNKSADSTPATDYLLTEALTWYKTNYRDFKDYDTDNDGFIDSVYMVYASPYVYTSSSSNASFKAREEELFWAYRYWNFDTTASIASPTGNSYAWGSFDFLKEGGYANDKVDAHTFIHETGHLLGLDDYYDYDNTTSPLGRVDMMDCNIGDHNAYSKLLLDWIDPLIVYKTATVTIRPFENSGDAIIIPAATTFSGMALDEYLILEYYTPDGLNESDTTPYANGFNEFTTSGLKVYHVDSRLGEFDDSDNFVGYTYNFVSYQSTSHYSSIAHSNTGSYSINQSNKLIHLVEAAGTTRLLKSSTSNSAKMANNNDLFTASKYKTLNSYKFNNGFNMNVTITVVSQNADGITLSFVTK